MGACGKTCTPDITNNLTLLHGAATLNPVGKFGHVEVLSGVGAIVFNFHVIPIATGISLCLYYAVRGG